MMYHAASLLTGVAGTYPNCTKIKTNVLEFITTTLYNPSLFGKQNDRRNTTTKIIILVTILSHCCSVAQSCLTLFDPTDCSTPVFPVLHHLPELAQTHVHWVCDAIQPSHLLSSPSSAFSLSQHQGLFTMSRLFTSGGQSIGALASVLPIFRIDFI